MDATIKLVRVIKRTIKFGVPSGILIALLLSLLYPAQGLKQAHAASPCTQYVTNTNDSGSGSLRQAILNTNSTSGSNYICFSINSGLQQIIPGSALPVITNTVTIDGTTQPGFNTNTYTPLIEISGNGAGANTIGLRITGNGAGSTIKGLIINNFSSNGIFLDSGNNTIVDNYVGTWADGNSAAPNKGDGIGIFSGTSAVNASNNTIGGSSLATRNVISGNGQNNPNGANGITITAQNGGVANNNSISGNTIGTNAAGTAVVANNGDGVLINDAGSGTLTGNFVGGTNGNTPGTNCAGSCNLISGNSANGVGLWHTGVSNATVLGNYIGTNYAGSTSLANGNIGVEAQNAPNNLIGGTSSSARNVISGNLGAGVFIDGGSATGDTIEGNFIGANSGGTYGIGNVKMGVGIGFATGVTAADYVNVGGDTGTTPGGFCTGACNLISGNGANGILIYGPGNNQILGNYIGTDVTGTQNIRNSVDGIGISGSPNNIIGDGTSAGRNVIAANGDNGIIIVSSSGNRIQSNYIGEGSNQISLGNAGAGVAIASGVSNAILGNDIDFNVGLGIDLNDSGSVLLNSPGGPHGRANNGQNFPNVYRAKTVGSTTKIGGELNSTPNTVFRLEFFGGSNCNAGVPNNYGQGESYLGAMNVATDQFGNTSFGFTPGVTVAGDQYITATATRLIGSTAAETSEFSKCILVNVDQPALSNGANWFLKDDLTSGPANTTFGYGFPSYYLLCAWDPNQPGVKLPVIFSNGTWFMRASFTTGAADLTFSYGASNATPICGDWNGDGVDTVGVVTPTMTWSLRNTNSSGPADISFQYGAYGSKPVAGDWNGDGVDTIGTVDSSNNWNLRNSNSNGSPDISFNYGFTPGYPVVGDWNGSGIDTVGSVSGGGTWALRTSNSSGPANITFQYGFPGAVPIY